MEAASVCGKSSVGGRIGRVASRDVKKAILAKLQITAVMTASHPGDQDLFTPGINPGRIGIADGEARHARAIQKLLAGGLAVENVTDIAIAILGKLRMKCQSVNSFDSFDFALWVPTVDFRAHVAA